MTPYPPAGYGPAPPLYYPMIFYQIDKAGFRQDLGTGPNRRITLTHIHMVLGELGIPDDAGEATPQHIQ